MVEKKSIYDQKKETERINLNARTLFKLKSYLTVYEKWDKHRLERVVNGFYARHKCESSNYREGSEKWEKARRETEIAQEAIKQFGYKGDTPIADVVELKYDSVMRYGDPVGTFTIHRVMLPVQSYEEYEPDWNEDHYFVSYYCPSSIFTEVFFDFDEIMRYFRNDIQSAMEHDQWQEFYEQFNPSQQFTVTVDDKKRKRWKRLWPHHHILDKVIKKHWLKGCPITWNNNGDVTLYDLGGIEERIFFGEDILKLATINKENIKVYDEDDYAKEFNIAKHNPSEFYAEIWDTIEPIKIGAAYD